MATQTASYTLPDKAQQALRRVELSQTFHDEIVKKHRVRMNAFEGRMEHYADAAQWQSRLHPPYLNHIVETSVASMLDDRLLFKITPKPRLYTSQEFELALLGAKAHEALHRQQLDQDRFHEQQRPITLLAAVNGWAFAKTFWRNDVAPRTKLIVENGAPPEAAAQGVFVPKLTEKTTTETVFDGPVTEACDPRDVYWEEAAVSIEKAAWVAHAVWLTLDDIQALAKKGVYDQAAVDDLQRPIDGPQETDIEREREKRGRKKGRIEVLEIWDRASKRVTTIGGRRVLLRDRPWPFWHNQYPFVAFATQPFPFSLQGMSTVEKLRHLQEAVWDLMNQRHDNLKFLNNAIAIVRTDVDDPNLPYEPQAQWFLEDPTAVQMWTPPPQAAEISLPAEDRLTQAMQDLAGGHPMTSTTDAAAAAGTATEAALVANVAQGMEQQAKTQLYYGYQRVGQQRTELNQQFIREPVYSMIVGPGDTPLLQEILPEILQGDYLFDMTPMSESLMRSERRAEAQGLFQVVMGSAAVSEAAGSPWNVRAVQEDLLDAFDKVDKDRYFSPPQEQGGGPKVSVQLKGSLTPDQEVMAAQQEGLQPPQQPTPGGVTAPQAVQADTSPSHQSSISPEVFAQRALALRGGAANG